MLNPKAINLLEESLGPTPLRKFKEYPLKFFSLNLSMESYKAKILFNRPCQRLGGNELQSAPEIPIQQPLNFHPQQNGQYTICVIGKFMDQTWQHQMTSLTIPVDTENNQIILYPEDFSPAFTNMTTPRQIVIGSTRGITHYKMQLIHEGKCESVPFDSLPEKIIADNLYMLPFTPGKMHILCVRGKDELNYWQENITRSPGIWVDQSAPVAQVKLVSFLSEATTTSSETATSTFSPAIDSVETSPRTSFIKFHGPIDLAYIKLLAIKKTNFNNCQQFTDQEWQTATVISPHRLQPIPPQATQLCIKGGDLSGNWQNEPTSFKLTQSRQ